jgi:hypothetical protein
MEHPNIVKFYQCVYDNEYLNIVMELVRRQPLSTIMEEKGRIPEPECQIIIRQIMQEQRMFEGGTMNSYKNHAQAKKGNRIDRDTLNAYKNHAHEVDEAIKYRNNVFMICELRDKETKRGIQHYFKSTLRKKLTVEEIAEIEINGQEQQRITSLLDQHDLKKGTPNSIILSNAIGSEKDQIQHG